MIGFGTAAEAANSRITVRDLRLGVPQTADDVAATAEDTPVDIDALANDFNARQPGFAPVVVQGPAHGTLTINTDGSFRYTPEADWSGADSFSYKLSDNAVDSNHASVTVNVAPVNDAPVAADAVVTTAEDTPSVVDLRTHVVDVDSAILTPAIVTGPLHGALEQNADGSYTYTPDTNWNGTDSFTWKASDAPDAGTGLDSNIATVTLNVTPVNDAPVIASRSVTLDEDTQAVIDLLQGASDVDAPKEAPLGGGDTLNVTITTAPQHGSLTQNVDGSFTYTPNANWNGTDTVAYEVSDGIASTPTILTFVVNGVNDAPLLGNQALAGNEDSALTGNLLATASDVEGSALTPTIVTGPQHGTLAQNADQTFTYTPEANFNGSDSFTYKVNDGQLDSNIATVGLTVSPVNDAPTANPIAATLLQDGSIILDLLASASDIDGDPLTLSVDAPPHGALTHNVDGTWTYTPAAHFSGEDSFNYTVSDGLLSASSLVRLTITAVNNAPLAIDDSATLDEDKSIRLALLANDVDADGDALTIQIVSQPTHGSIVLNADNTVSYTPTPHWSGADNFTYRLSDGHALSEVATVQLIVNAMADAPTLVLSPTGSNTRELFRTGWESAANINSSSTLVTQDIFEGWTLLTQPDHSFGGMNGFEIWTAGDKMSDSSGVLRTVSAAAGDGKNWLELNDAMLLESQTLGIQRSVDTVAGASYTLSMDYAGRLGYSTNYTRIGIYVDGQKIGTYANTSPTTALNWQNVQFSFTGTGGKPFYYTLVERPLRLDLTGSKRSDPEVAEIG